MIIELELIFQLFLAFYLAKKSIFSSRKWECCNAHNSFCSFCFDKTGNKVDTRKLSVEFDKEKKINQERRISHWKNLRILYEMILLKNLSIIFLFRWYRQNFAERMQKKYEWKLEITLKKSEKLKGALELKLHISWNTGDALFLAGGGYLL
jgi:hypothetical protein